MKKSTVNTFSGGLAQDFPNIQTPKQVYTYLENGTFITNDGNELMLQNEKGDVEKAKLKDNFIPLDVKSFGNIAYIISAEVIYKDILEVENQTVVYQETATTHSKKLPPGTYRYEVQTNVPVSNYILNSPEFDSPIFTGSISDSEIITFSSDKDFFIKTNKTFVTHTVKITTVGTTKGIAGLTGKGEIGTFPSPDYNNTTVINSAELETGLVFEYRPFMNYAGDLGTPQNPINPSDKYGEFTSSKFNFNLKHPVRIISVQPAYDDTVNVIFTDGFNTPKIINSRFSIVGDRVRIVDRQGSNDANLYTVENFDNRLNQILTTSKLLFVQYGGYELDGNLQSGTYQYFFKYATQDGNVTDVAAQSFKVPVFLGETIAQTRMSVNREETNKSNVFTLTNLDTNYDSLEVLYTYSRGQDGIDSQDEYYKINRKYPITGNQITFKHTGTESTTLINQDEINTAFQAIETYKAGCELKGRLFIANIKSRQYDLNPLKEFASNIKIFTSKKRMELYDRRSDIELNYLYDKINYNNIVYSTFKDGYYNPRNVHDYLGYWGAETYCFSVEFIFKNNTSSPLIPVRGIDNLNDDATYSDNTLSTDNPFNRTTGENINGIYRFPKRKPNWVGSSFAEIYAVDFEIPEFTNELKELGIIGIRFHRTQRKIDCVGQGMLIDTIPMPIGKIGGLESVTANTERWSNYPNDNFFTNVSDYTEDNSKFVPAFNYILEGHGKIGFNKDSKATGEVVKQNIGVTQCQFRFWNRDSDWSEVDATSYKNKFSFWRYKKFAFYSNEFISNKIRTASRFNSSNAKLDPISIVSFIGAFPTPVIDKGTNEQKGLRIPSVIVPNTAYQDYAESLTITEKNILKAALENVNIEFVEKGNTGVTENRFSSRSYVNFLGEELQINPDVRGTALYGISDSNEGGVYYTPINNNYNDYVGVSLKNNNGFILNETQVLNVEKRCGTFLYTNPENLNEFGNGLLVNVYPRGEIKKTEQLEDLYIPSSEQFFPISQKYYFTDELAAEEGAVEIDFPTNILPSIESNSFENKITFYGGDCYVGHTYRKVFNSDYSDQIVDDIVDLRNINVGYTLSFVSESNFNVAARDIQIFAVNELGQREPYPYAARSNDVGGINGRTNSWRKNRLPESEQINTSNSDFRSAKNYISLDTSIPFIQNVFDTDVAYSQPYFSKSLLNGYRVFLLLARQSYSSALGAITNIVPFQNNLLIVQQYGVTLVPINERVGGVQDSASPIFFQDAGVLAEPQYVKYISEQYGSKWGQSVVSTDNTVYGVDIDGAKIWRMEDGRLNLISDFKIQSFLRQIKSKFDSKTELSNILNIRGYYDEFKRDVLFTFTYPDLVLNLNGQEEPEIVNSCPIFSLNGSIISIDQSEPQFIESNDNIYSSKSKTIVYNEIPTNQWKTYNSFNPSCLFGINDRIYTFNQDLQNNNTLFQKYKSEKYSYYFNKQHDFVVEFVATDNTTMHQIFTNLMIIGNEVYPKKIEYTTDSGTVLQVIKPRNKELIGSAGFLNEPENNIFTYNAVYKEDHMYITINNDSDDTSNSISNNRRIRDKYCRIRITYDSSKHVFIQAIYTIIVNSNS